MSKDVLRKLYKALKVSQERVRELERAQSEPIAIVGMACRFPGGADSVEAYRELIEGGMDAIVDTPSQRWSDSYHDPNPAAPGRLYGNRGGFLRDDIRRFDARFFHLTPLEVRSMDPQQRLLLEVAWETFENAGLDVTRYEGTRTGVFCGICNSDYANAHLRSGDPSRIDAYSVTGIAPSAAVGRLSYLFGFQGPNLALDTACSSSLVAVHLACQSLRLKESDLALAGGVNLILTPEGHIGFSKLKALAPDGRCKPFDASADGYGRGEGCGLVLLKRLGEALLDRDPIVAVLRGSAVNQDGRSNGFTAPNGLAQEEVIRAALRAAAMEPKDITYLEAHGTGTPLGDPIEVESAAAVYGEGRNGNFPLIIGAVKANIGHLEGAAAVASLIKAALVLRGSHLPPQPNFVTPNPGIPWKRLPVLVNAEPLPWPETGGLRTAAVSSFSFSGTNAHLILQEPPPAEAAPLPAASDRSHHLLNISAASETSLKGLAARYAKFLGSTNSAIGDICYSAATGRAELSLRLSVVGDTKEALRERLTEYLAGKTSSRLAVSPGVVLPHGRKPAFLFTGQGSQYHRMGQDLYETSPVFRNALRECHDLLRNEMDMGLIDLIYGEDGQDLINKTRYAQPAIFAVEYALFRLLESWGLRPDFVMGHSIGEYVAAWSAGVFSLGDALRLVASRGRLMQSLPENGKMAVVLADEASVRAAITSQGERVSIAGLNAPENTAISGYADSVDRVLEYFRDRNIPSQVLQISHAIHSPLMDPILDDFRAVAETVEYHAPASPLVANETGTTAGPEIAEAGYWVRHIRQKVRFIDTMHTLAREGCDVFIEVGTTTALSSLGMQCLSGGDYLWVPTLGVDNFLFNLRPHRQDAESDWERLLWAVAELRVQGLDLDWPAFDGPYHRVRCPLPNYVFDRTVHWIDPILPGAALKPCPLNTESNQASDLQAVRPLSEDKPSGISRPEIASRVRELLRRASELEIIPADQDRNFFELGFASLMLARVRDAIARTYGISIPMNWFYDRAGSFNKLVDSLEAEIKGSQQRMATESAHLGQAGAARNEPSQPRRSISPDKKASYVPYQRIGSREAVGFNHRQKAHLEELIRSYTSHTANSKTLTERYRPVLSNIRNIAGFRPEWKEMIYQIIAERAEGSKFIDADGREYLDLTMGFGVYLFGHNPPFVRDALRQELDRGMPIGPMSGLAGEVAALIHELTGVERVAFFNSGTEAVMSALRIARTVTGRERVVLFAGSFHGHFDGVLAVHDQDLGQSVPMSPGTPMAMVRDVTVLPYGTEESLEFIRTHGRDLAAVLVEPVQSRRPEFQPVEFLRELRQITRSTDTCLIFDEMILGFRMHSAGVQGLFDIRADLVTYGKVIGGGLPIGAVAGSARYMDAVDGGMWQYGDQSVPERENAFIAGTFNHHPLAMAGARAVLERLRQEGPELQEGLNRRTAEMAEELNAFFAQAQLPIGVTHFGSLFRLDLRGDQELLTYHLLDKRIYIWEGRNCFLSTAHSDGDIAFFIDAVKEGVSSMRSAGHFALPLRETHHDFLLSSIQRRIYALCQFEGADISYHVPIAASVEGDIDPLEIEDAFRKLIERHESLRTSFHVEDGTFIQRVHDTVDFSVEYREAPEEERETLAQSFMVPFDLAQAPLVRVFLVRHRPQRHFLFVDVHHIVSDGVSSEILVAELLRLLNRKFLPPAPSGYRAYVTSEEAYRQSELFREHEAYWLHHLGGELPALNLLPDRQRPAVRSYRGARIFHQIGPERTRALKKVAGSLGASLFMTLYAAHYVLLHKLTGQEEIVVGTNFDGRLDDSLAGTVGMFTTTLAIRNRPVRDKRFADFLRELRETVLDAYDRQLYPFDLLVEKLHPRRQMSRNPLFDTLFVFEEIAARESGAGEIRIEKFDLDNRSAMFDLTQEILAYEGGLNVSIEYNSDLFEEGTARRYLAYYDRLLDSIIADAWSPLKEMEILPPSERELLATGFGVRAADYPRESTMADVFCVQAMATPELIAVVFEDRSLTYRELDERANGVARYLAAECGIGRNDLVGMMFGRSELPITAMLGILKSGAAFLPIDEAYPKDRIRYMIEDSGCRVILSESEHMGEEWLRTLGARLIDAAAVAAPEKDFTMPADRTSRDLAYTIYTSGTTGRPKGVMIEHRSLVNMALDHIGFFGIQPRDRVLQFSSFSSDSSLFEIFMALYCGAAVVMVRKDVLFDTERFLNYLLKKGVSVVFFPPVYLNSLEGREMPSVRVIITGGAPAVTADVMHYARTKTYFNSYGPTETTVAMTYYPVDPEAVYEGYVPVGRPIANTEVLILDAHLNLAPIGVPGEIYIGGDCLARGYLNRPELNAEKFVPHPFDPGRRIYCSGDFGRWLPDGNLQCLGRDDDQVKVRGFRIELKEVEHCLRGYPGIDRALVVARALGNQDNELIAYVITRSGLNVSELRRHLSRYLPDYMVPAHFVKLDAFPLTPNGKIDKEALPLPELAVPTPQAQGAYLFSDPIEGVLAEVWSAVLKRRDIGPHDDFFELGGDSIKAIQIISKLRSHNQVLEVRHLFETPTIRELAVRVRRKEQGGDARPQAVTIAESITGSIPFGPAQAWFFREHKGFELRHYSQSVLLRAEGRIEEAPLIAALQSVLDCHESLRMTYRALPDQVVQEPAAAHCEVALQRLDLRGQAGALEVLRDHAEIVAREMDLTFGPLMRAGLYRLDDADRIFVAVHHLAVDGISWRVLLEDLGQAYRDSLAGRQPALSPEGASFAIWAQGLQEFAQSPALLEQVPYWQGIEASGAAATIADAPEPPYLAGNMRIASLTLGEAVTEALTGPANRAYRTATRDLLLSALGRAIGRTRRIDGLMIDLEGHGRQDIGGGLYVERTVGWFTCVHPFVLPLSHGGGFGPQIGNVKEALRNVPMGGVGYWVLKYLTPGTMMQGLTCRARPDLIFNYLGSFAEGEMGPFRLDQDFKIRSVSDGMPRSHGLEVQVLVTGDRMRIDLSYDAGAYRRESIEALLASYGEELAALAEHCLRRPETPTYDFASLSLGPDEWSALLQGAGLDPAQVTDLYPLSPLQEGMLFHSLYNGPSAYFQQLMFPLAGALDPGAFQRAWNMLIERHEVLRTRFLHRGADRPLQAVLRKSEVEFHMEDIRGIAAEERGDLIKERRAADVRRGFALDRDMLMRVHLFWLADESFRVIWSYHHILFDGWCSGTLIMELFAAYRAIVGGRSPVLPSPPPYRNYIAWIEQLSREPALAHWRAYLDGYGRLASVPGRASTAEVVDTFLSDAAVIELSEESTRRLRLTAARQRVTLGAWVQTIWAVFLGKLCGLDDVIFGTTVSGRPPDLDGAGEMVGLFINTVPVRVHLDMTEGLDRLTQRVLTDMIGSEAYHYVSLAEIQSQSPLGQGLLDHVIVFENYPLAEELHRIDDSITGGFAISGVDVFERTNYDLTVVAVPAECLTIELRYNVAAYAPQAMQDMGRRLAVLIDAALERPDITVKTLWQRIASDEERREADAFMSGIMEIDERY